MKENCGVLAGMMFTESISKASGCKDVPTSPSTKAKVVPIREIEGTFVMNIPGIQKKETSINL